MKSVINRKLLQKAQDYDERALAEIYDRWSEPIYRYAVRLLGERDLAEECVSETFNRFLASLRNNKGPEDHLQAYLFRIAHNWIADTYRKQAPLSVQLTDELHATHESEPPQIVAEKWEKHQVRESLKYLTPDQRQVITLKYIEGWGNAEIARALGKPVGAIKALQHRGLATLRQILLHEEEHSK
jgi:RNA polymerase sigma-70 factor (ECF subfamily)